LADCWGSKRAFYIDCNNNLSSIPVDWTNILAPDPFIYISNGNSPLHVLLLLELADFIKVLKENM
jgi:hypothetical protein